LLRQRQHVSAHFPYTTLFRSETVMVAHTEQPRAAYRIRRDRYELADPGLSPEELAALHLAATSVRLVGIPVDEVEDALRKLGGTDRKSTRLNSSHVKISYAVY